MDESKGKKRKVFNGKVSSKEELLHPFKLMVAKWVQLYDFADLQGNDFIAKQRPASWGDGF